MSNELLLVPFRHLERFRMTGRDSFSASCPTPAHLYGDRHPSLAGRIRGGRLFPHCFAGCSTQDILAAMGLEWSDLFVDSVIPWNPGSKYRANVFNGFRRRRQFQTLRTGDELRQRDAARLTALSAFEDGSFDEEVLYICLAEIYRGYSELEYQFEILRTGSDEEALELFHG